MSKENPCGSCDRYPDVKEFGILDGACDVCKSFPPDGFKVCPDVIHGMECLPRTGCPTCLSAGIVPEDVT